MANWWTGLLCVRCGRKVQPSKVNGFYCKPVKGEPWVKHVGPCTES